MQNDHTVVNGSIGEHLACAAFLACGWKVYHQDHESGPTDLVIERDGAFSRVQVRSFYVDKYRPVPKVRVHFRSRSGNGTVTDIRQKVDFFALVDTLTGEVYLMPSAQAPASNMTKGEVQKLATKLLLVINNPFREEKCPHCDMVYRPYEMAHHLAWHEKQNAPAPVAKSDLCENAAEIKQHIAGGRSWPALKESKVFDSEKLATSPLFDKRLF